MSELEEKLGKLLSDPNMMQQIMGIANMLSGGQSSQEEPKKEPEQASAPPSAPVLDPMLLQHLSTMQRGPDKNQEVLIHALQPYLSRQRIQKLERAMGAARMASAASAFLNAGGLRLLTSR